MQVTGLFISAIWLAIATAAGAQDEPLPDSVALAYQAYETALAGEDYPAASRAAEQAFGAARESGLPGDMQLTLGLNALAMAPSRGTGSGLVQLTRDTAALAHALGEHEAGFDAWLRGLWGASSSRNYVAFDILYAGLLNLTVKDDHGYSEWLLSIARIEQPRYAPAFRTSEERQAGALEFERARDLADLDALANAAIRLQIDARTREDWTAALEVTRTTLVELAGDDPHARDARDAVSAFLSDILRDGFSSTDSGESHLPAVAREAWCDYLTRRPVALDYIFETPMPMRAVERNMQGVVRTVFTVPAAGGLPQLGASQAGPPRISILQNASRTHLAQTRFRPACAGQALPIEGVLLEGFAVETGQRRGGRAEFGIRVFSTFTQ